MTELAIKTEVGILIGELTEVPLAGIASVAVMLVLFGWVFGAMALALGAAIGRTKIASLATTGIAILSYLVFAFSPFRTDLSPGPSCRHSPNTSEVILSSMGSIGPTPSFSSRWPERCLPWQSHYSTDETFAV